MKILFVKLTTLTALLTLSALLLSALLMPTHVLSAEKITIATTEYEPFTSSKAKHNGFVNRVIKAAFEVNGFNVEFKYRPWKRALIEGHDKFDGVSFSFANKEREQEYLFSDTLSEHREVLFHLKKTTIPNWNSLSDLKDLKFGLTRGYTYTQALWDLVENKTLKASIIATDINNFKKLAAGKVDIFPMDEITGWRLISTELPVAKETLAIHSKALRSTTGHLIISKKRKNAEDLLMKFNEGLKKLKETKTYDQYLDDLFKGIY
ncbi:transporter substrate-binding domain-containing protein [Endozoicomonas sp. SM1973]|uniref:Transporter substrate-binding domain-containing protein n=1 Tax=Spartinivicinus marinus TaxID=2994442 RepID=A0A853ICH8_9GAMM|nr:transporter substrate-binding domain-containing protein [Spartinivicinus marinus]MCX4028560.1 transporter substrate-binding domain-containing protein [Spartinivicinus marinus]NYZ67227.1 transporter substrate-binding domain-containing protein [Spartinivicinus marinus]